MLFSIDCLYSFQVNNNNINAGYLEKSHNLQINNIFYNFARRRSTFLNSSDSKN